ncbi:hypothetical protein A9Q81_01145 [Gammaproteobacteria bacterium 42_54_T18]|nr:hypothetical protein A9Q81_01145 [Gammaproteobacteria bacterium 42_54_T18]
MFVEIIMVQFYTRFRKRLGACILSGVVASFLILILVFSPSTTSLAVLASTDSLNLHQYRSFRPPVVLKGVHNNASGLTYNHEKNTLFLVINNPEKIIEIDVLGNELRHILLEGFEDTEAITYLGRNNYAIAEERRRSIVIVKIDANTDRLIRSQQRSLTLPMEGTNNKGFEGIASDPDSGRLYVSNEKEPKKVFQLDGFVDDTSHLSVSSPWSLDVDSLDSEDISGLYFDHELNHILLLSDESQQLIEASLEGEVISTLDLSDNNAGIFEEIPQAEGVALGPNNTLYILSEPNLLFSFSK